MGERLQEESPGGTVVLLHGIGLGAWFWEPWKAIFSPSYRWMPVELHAPDQPQGLGDLVETVAQKVATISGRVVIVGHSMGALVALMVAARRAPDALVLVSPLPPGQIRMLPPRTRLSSILKMAPSFLTGKALKIDRESYRSLGMNLLSDAEVDRWFPKVVAWPNRLVKDLALPPVVQPPSCPVLIAIGKEDRLVPWEKARIMGDLFEAVVWRYDNLAHSPPIEAGGERMARDILAWSLEPSGPRVLESEGFGPSEGVGEEFRRKRRGEEMKRRSAYGQKLGKHGNPNIP